jgi:hypothetical protein
MHSLKVVKNRVFSTNQAGFTFVANSDVYILLHVIMFTVSIVKCWLLVDFVFFLVKGERMHAFIKTTIN